MKKQKERLARKSYRRRAEDENSIHEEFRQAQNLYSEAIRKAKDKHCVGWLETLDEGGIWAVNHMTSGAATDGGRNRIPTLLVKDPITKRIIKEARSNIKKGQLLYQAFFPKRSAPPVKIGNYHITQEK